MQLASGRIRLSTLCAIPCTTHPNTPLSHDLTKSRLALQCYFNHTFMIKTVVQYIHHFEIKKGIQIFYFFSILPFFFFLGKMVDPGVLAHLHAGHHQFKSPNIQVGAG